jgi:16S rRNA (guanine966-N2)-methyltransferase
MRIIAGSLGGRRIDAPPGRTTRPTSDRVREAVFSRLDAIAGGVGGRSVLDLYAGSGAMGLEALSRGAACVLFVERDRRAATVLERNISSLGVSDDVVVARGDVASIAESRELAGSPFGLLILDPPYRIENAEVREVIDSLVARDAIASGCVLVWEHGSDTEPEPGEMWKSLGSKRYGTTTVTVYEASSES